MKKLTEEQKQYIQQIIEEGDDLVVKPNEFYKKGLTQSQVVAYYLAMWDKIKDQFENKDLMIRLYTEPNKSVIIRKDKSTGKRLRVKDYDDFVKLIRKGAAVELHKEIDFSNKEGYTDTVIVDIDPGDKVKWKRIKEVTKKVYNVLKSTNLFKKLYIRFSGNRAFHVIGHFKPNVTEKMLKIYIKSSLNTSDDIVKTGSIVTSWFKKTAAGSLQKLWRRYWWEYGRFYHDEYKNTKWDDLPKEVQNDWIWSAMEGWAYEEGDAIVRWARDTFGVTIDPPTPEELYYAFDQLKSDEIDNIYNVIMSESATGDDVKYSVFAAMCIKYIPKYRHIYEKHKDKIDRYVR